MAIGPRVLSPGHARRSRMCDASRVARRNIARKRVQRSLEGINAAQLQNNQGLINLNGCNEFQRTVAMALDTEPLLQHNNNGVQQESVIVHQEEDQHPQAVRLTDFRDIIEPQGLRATYAHNEPMHQHTDEINDRSNLEGNYGGIQQEPIMINREGEYSKVQAHCLSIRYLYPETTNLKHSSTLSLYHGKCLLHNIGSLDYTCSKCGALAWKIEGKTILTFVGKNCCGSGNVSLPPLCEPPIELRELMQGNNPRSRDFLRNIRAYNTALAFASLGAHVDDSLGRGHGIYTFKVHGSIYHKIGSLVPEERSDQVPRFAQLYFYDTENELQNRMHHVSGLKPDVMQSLQSMMHRVNPYVHAFRAAASMVQNCNVPEIRMVITEKRERGWQYLAPRGVEIAAIMPGQGEERNIGHRDIVLNYRDGRLKRISNLHRSYMPLLYVLLFPRGEEGWHPLIKRLDRDTKHVSQMEYYTYRLQIRNDTVLCFLRGGRLLQQYIVDAYSSMEEVRLLYIRDHQTDLRSDVYQGLADMVGARDGAGDRSDPLMGSNVGRRVVLPSSYVGGPRYMHQLYQDAMAIVSKRGKPDLFITFTCNPQWKEIDNALLPGQVASDRPDLTARVFYHKFKDLMHLLIQNGIFGKVIGHISVIEFQKRGLPHAHILLILAPEDKPTEVSHYDKIVCAELPDKNMFPQLFDVISRCNVHAPCGDLNKNASCMVEGKCRFRYPRKFHVSTTVDRDGYPTYMRRDDGNYTVYKTVRVDNRWIVPYNPFLSLRYRAHINVEICSTISAVKYLYKYVYKGHDRATVVLQDSDGVLDEIKSYLGARYVSASEAIWRIYGFDLHQEKPDIQRLHVHLPLQNHVFFRDSTTIQSVVDRDANKKTTLTEWFVANQENPEANELLYVDFPTKWVWHSTAKTWTLRQRGDAIGRMYNIVPSAGDLYYLRVLLTKCKGCKSFEDIRTFNGRIYDSFKEACNARGLLANDDEWLLCLEEASSYQLGEQLRLLFVVILVFCEPVSPGALWTRFCKELSEDYVHHIQVRINDEQVCNRIAQNQALKNLDSRLQHYGKKLSDYSGMPIVDHNLLVMGERGVLADELMYNVVEQRALASKMEDTFNVGQRAAYNRVLQAIETSNGNVFFLDGPGGTGKTYLYNALLSRVRGDQKVALACASSGIAAQLLSNGRTAHSRFKIPLDVNSESTCNIKVNSQLAELLRRASLIIWDEAPMIHRHAFEALDRTLRDVMQIDVLFGGKVFLLGGDFRQILPVVRKGLRADIVDASLCHSYIWNGIEVLRLTQNMRVVNCLDNAMEREFVQWTLDIGNGNVCDGGLDDNVALPACMVLQGGLQALIDCIYKDLETLSGHASFFRDRAILAPRNKNVNTINSLALQQMHGRCHEYVSADSVCKSNCDSILFTVEFMNSLDLGGGFPPHILQLKENAPVMLLRNLDPRRGLCNGTRLICKAFHSKVIDAEIITGSHANTRVFIPRIDFYMGSREGLPFEMKRRQFPLRLAFGMTINKAQGQTLGVLGIYLATPIFTHGQLYVALSRVRTASAIRIVIDDNLTSTISREWNQTIYTTNIVYREVLQVTNS